MKKSEVLQAWRGILSGRRPSLSIEITKECPLRCPGCYAFDQAHLGGEQELRQLSDFRGDELVRRVVALVDEHQPLHVSLVGGDPLVRYRELEQIIPAMEERGIHTQIVTSAFRRIPPEWSRFERLNAVVSIDGLQPEHDERRKPATYERILKSIAGSQVTIHCTITGNIATRPGYLEEFLRFWTPRPEIRKVWFSLFTPQRGATGPEILTAAQRREVMEELLRLRPLYPSLDMPEAVIREIATPPNSPGGVRLCADDCYHLRRSEDQGDALPVWRRSGLRAMWLHRYAGTGGGGPSPCGRRAYGRTSLSRLRQYWPALALADAAHTRTAAGSTALHDSMKPETRMTEMPLTQLPKTRATAHSESASGSARCERTLREELAGCSADLHTLGYAPGTSGNVSARLDGARVLATPTGCSKRVIGPEDVVVVDMDGRQLAGARHVTSEIDMHLAIYKARPDVEAVVHAHPVFATAFASSGLALDQPLCSEVVMTLGSIPLAAYATTGTCEVRQTLAPYLQHHDAVLLANHGV